MNTTVKKNNTTIGSQDSTNQHVNSQKLIELQINYAKLRHDFIEASDITTFGLKSNGFLAYRRWSNLSHYFINVDFTTILSGNRVQRDLAIELDSASLVGSYVEGCMVRWLKSLMFSKRETNMNGDDDLFPEFVDVPMSLDDYIREIDFIKLMDLIRSDLLCGAARVTKGCPSITMIQRHLDNDPLQQRFRHALESIDSSKIMSLWRNVIQSELLAEFRLRYSDCLSWGIRSSYDWRNVNQAITQLVAGVLTHVVASVMLFMIDDIQSDPELGLKQIFKYVKD